MHRFFAIVDGSVERVGLKTLFCPPGSKALEERIQFHPLAPAKRQLQPKHLQTVCGVSAREARYLNVTKWIHQC